jgi:hypothetical protein
LYAIFIFEGVGFVFKKKVARGTWVWPNEPTYNTRGRGAN